MRFRPAILSALCLLCTGFPFTSAQDEPAADVLIRAQHLYTGTGDVLSPGSVLIRNGRIEAVGAELEVGSATLVSVHSLIPGLVDAYTQTGLGGADREQTEELTPGLTTVPIIDWSARDFQEQLESGTTCLGVAPGTENVISGLGCAVKTAGEQSRRVVSERTGLFISLCSDPTSGNGARSRPDSIYVRQPTNRMGVVWMLRTTMHAAQNSQDADKTLQEALRGDLPVFSVSRTDHDIRALLTLSEEFRFRPSIIGGQEAWRSVDAIAAGVESVVLERQAPWTSRGGERTRTSAETAARLAEHGVRFCFSQGDLLDQARFAVKFGLPRDAALNAITSAPAAILNIDDRVGTIAVGRDADLVAVSADLFEFTSAIQWVMVDGTIRYRQDSSL